MKNFKKGDYVFLKNVPESWGTVATTIFQIKEISEKKIVIGHRFIPNADYECNISDIDPIAIKDKDNLDHCFYIHDEPQMMGVIPKNGCPNEIECNHTYYLESDIVFKNGKTIRDIIEESNCKYIHELQSALRDENIVGRGCYMRELEFDILLQYKCSF